MHMVPVLLHQCWSVGKALFVMNVAADSKSLWRCLLQWLEYVLHLQCMLCFVYRIR